MSFSEPIYIFLHLAGFAFLVSLAISGFMVAAGFFDKPIDRSNHKTQIPTCGGIGIIAGIGAGLLALTQFYPVFADHHILATITSLLVGVAFLGLMDDIYDLRASTKFVVLIFIAAMAVTLVGAPKALPYSVLKLDLAYPISFAGAMLWLFVVMNGINFIDGSNGMMGTTMLISFVFLALIAFVLGAMSTALLSTLIAAAILGFLPYNWRNSALIFSGDVGSLSVGFAFAIASLLLVVETDGVSLVYVGPLLILPILTDIFMTMLMRAKRRENLMSAHSHHMYQRFIRSGLGHLRVSYIYSFAAVVAGTVTLVGIKTGMIRSLYFLLLMTAMWVFVYLVLHQKFPSVTDQQQTQPDP